MLRWMQKSEALLAPGLLAVWTVAVADQAGAGEAGEAAGGAPVPELAQDAVPARDPIVEFTVDAVRSRDAASGFTPGTVPDAPERPSSWLSQLTSSSMSVRRNDPGPWAAPGASEAPASRSAVGRRERLQGPGTFAPSPYARKTWGPPVDGSVVLEHRRTRTSLYGSQRESYLALKGGGLRVGEDSATDGLFLGFEVGGSLQNVFEIGFSADYYYRSTDNVLVLSQANFENLPLQVVESDHTSAHLLPLGVTLRLRLPVSETVSPFVSTTLSYEMLFLENVGGGGTGDPLRDALAEDETFTGFGWQAAAGLGIRLAPAVGLFGEAGYHWGSPSQGFLIQGVPVDLKVDMDGAFVRGGLRFDI